ncbi:SAP domain-containing protein [bacterium]|nr:SAP domain-containing protein [bacterium]
MAEALEEMRDAGRGIVVRSQEQRDIELELERQEGFLQGQESFGIPQTSFPPAAPAPSELPRDPISRLTNLENMRVPELKRLLSMRGRSTSGNKPDLIQRLRESN